MTDESNNTLTQRGENTGPDASSEAVDGRFWTRLRHWGTTSIDSGHSIGLKLGRIVFGDRYGLTLFCATLAVYMLYWRVGVFINDTYTVANAFVALSEGHLHVDEAVYGSDLETPGMVAVDGLAYGRNYGQLVLALPFVWAIEVVAAVADLRVALAAGWSLLLLSLTLLVGSLIDEVRVDDRTIDVRSLSSYIGSGLALGSYVVVLQGATPIDPVWHHLLALQLQTMIAAALVGVVLYRLLLRIHGRRVGLAAGFATVLATPVGFWASFPKRHVFVALGVVGSAYCLYRSREAANGEGREIARHHRIGRRMISEETYFRALAYVTVGFITWVHPLEGVILLVALLLVDLPTGNLSPQSYVSAGGAFLLSLVPWFVTNYLISGDPLKPPDLFGRYSAAKAASPADETTGGASSPSTEGGTTAGSTQESTSIIDIAGEMLETTLDVGHRAMDFFGSGIAIVTSDFERLGQVFLRSGYLQQIAERDGGEAIRLAFLESLPLAAALFILPVLVCRSDVRDRIKAVRTERRLSSVGTIDAFVCIYASIAIIMYIPRLPLHAQVTVRYLLGLAPLTIYGVARVPAVRRVVMEQLQISVGAYVAGVFIGGQVLVLWLFVTEATLGESIQAHALVGLTTAALVGGWAFLDIGGQRCDRVGAVVLGLAAAGGTVFLLLAGLWHFSYAGTFAIPIMG